MTSLEALAGRLRSAAGVRHKLDIQAARDRLGPGAIAVGDDCAAIPDADGFLLFAIEGMLDSFVAAEPWFAGYSAVMVNLSDVAAMGGRAIAVVDSIGSGDPHVSSQLWQGMTDAAAKYAVPIVGGHTNARADSPHLSVAVLGRAKRLLTSFDARPGDVLIHATDLRGEWFGEYPFFNASTAAPAERLRADLELLPTLAERGLAHAAKDISMAGLVGTAVMLAESSGAGVTIDLAAIPTPAGADFERWLLAFPSFGYLLAARPDRADEACTLFRSRDLAARVIGSFDDSSRVAIAEGDERATVWDLSTDALTGFGPESA